MTPEERKAAARIRASKWYWDNLERARLARRRYHLENAEKIANYRNKNREKRKAYCRSWRTKNKDKYLGYAREYAKNNRENRAAYMKLYRSKNKLRISQLTKAYTKENRDQIYLREKKRAHERRRRAKDAYWKNRESYLRKQRIRRARKKSHSTKDQIRMAELKIGQLKSLRSYCCCYCGTMDSPRALQVEHIIPYNKGGSHSPENIDLACKSCNSSKADRILNVEWSPVKNRWSNLCH